MEAIKDVISFVPSQMSDRYLFQQISEGNDNAMKFLFDKYYENLCQFCKIYEPNSANVEEKVADVFIQIWKNRDNLSKIINPKIYLYVSVRNSLKKTSKYEQVHCQLNINSEFTKDIPIPSTEELIIEKEQVNDLSKQIESILSKIPARSRQVFELSRIENLKYSEISKQLNISIKTVEVHMSTAIKLIRKYLKSNQ